LIDLLTSELRSAWEQAISQGVAAHKVAAALDRSRDAIREMVSPRQINDLPGPIDISMVSGRSEDTEPAGTDRPSMN
jgi:hypothetical protein